MGPEGALSEPQHRLRAGCQRPNDVKHGKAGTEATPVGEAFLGGCPERLGGFRAVQERLNSFGCGLEDYLPTGAGAMQDLFNLFMRRNTRREFTHAAEI